jgi:hypothetical protein
MSDLDTDRDQKGMSDPDTDWDQWNVRSGYGSASRRCRSKKLYLYYTLNSCCLFGRGCVSCRLRSQPSNSYKITYGKSKSGLFLYIQRGTPVLKTEECNNAEISNFCFVTYKSASVSFFLFWGFRKFSKACVKNYVMYYIKSSDSSRIVQLFSFLLSRNSWLSFTAKSYGIFDFLFILVAHFRNRTKIASLLYLPASYEQIYRYSQTLTL